MAIYSLGDRVPKIHPSAYISPEATIIGAVTLGEDVTVWPGAVIRADDEPISVGNGSNVQEGAVLHIDFGYPAIVGENVTIGHQAMIHGCKIGNGCLIGMQAIVLTGAVIGENTLVGAGALVTEGKEIPARSLAVGMPAKVIRELSEEQIAGMLKNSAHYAKRAQYYRDNLKRIG